MTVRETRISWLDDEPIGIGLVLGGSLVLTGVYIGALRRARSPAPPRTRAVCDAI